MSDPFAPQPGNPPPEDASPGSRPPAGVAPQPGNSPTREPGSEESQPPAEVMGARSGQPGEERPDSRLEAGGLPAEAPSPGEERPWPPAPEMMGPLEAPPPVAPPGGRERGPFWGYRDLMFLIAAGFVLALGVGAIARIFFKNPLNAVQALGITFAFEGLWFAVVYAVFRLGYGRPFWQSLGWARPALGRWNAFGWGLLAAFLCAGISNLLPVPHVQTPMEELMKGRYALPLMGFFAITLGPLLEELAFRGFLQPLLVSTFGAVGGVLLQAVPFAAMHGAEYAWSWQRLVVMFVAGSAFGWMRHRTGSTQASTFMHAGFNSVVFLGMLAENLSRVRHL